MSISKSSLAIMLSRLRIFLDADARLEQYPTDSEIASDALWNAYMAGNLSGRTVADLGCGTGILGIGALLLGAKKVFFIDKDKNALRVLKENLLEIKGLMGLKKNYTVIEGDICDFKEQVDTVIQNPPFGTRQKHIDRDFLEKAFEISTIVYSFHKTATAGFIRKFASEKDFMLKEKIDYKFPLKKSMQYHKKYVSRIDVSLFVFQRSI